MNVQVYRSDEARTGVCNATGCAREPRLKWSRALGSKELYATPLQAGSALIVGGRWGLFALDRDSGDLLWQVKRSGPIHPPYVLRDTAIVGTRFPGSVLALDVHSGSERWSREIDGEDFEPSPLFADGRLYVLSSQGTLRVLRTEDGEVEREWRLGEAAIASPESEQAVEKRRPTWTWTWTWTWTSTSGPRHRTWSPPIRPSN